MGKKQYKSNFDQSEYLQCKSKFLKLLKAFEGYIQPWIPCDENLFVLCTANFQASTDIVKIWTFLAIVSFLKKVKNIYTFLV